MPDRTRQLADARRTRRTAAAIGAAVAAVAVAAGMLVTGRTVDLWTATLVAAVALTITTAPWATLAGRRRANPALFEEVDARTGVGTARAALSLVDRELERAHNYDSAFSLAVLELDRGMFSTMSPRRAHKLVSALVTGLASDVRLGDRVCHAAASDRELVVVVLPDTGPQGANTFAGRLVAHTQRHLADEGLAFDGQMRVEALSHPDDLPAMERLRRRLEVLDGTEALIRDVAVRQRRAWRTAELGPVPDRELSASRPE